MTDNLPAVVRDEPRDVTRADTDSWIGVVGEVAKFAGYIADTDFVPKSLRGNPAAATAAVMYGREVGLPPMTSLTQTHVIEGRPALSAEAKRALVLSQGHELEVIESTGGICKMRAKRRGSERWTPEVIWTIDMARAAGLTNKSNWKNHPRRMLQARASGELCDLHFPDVVLGFTTIEELEDDGGIEVAHTTTAEQATTKVGRARKVAAKRAPAALTASAPPPERPADAGPPLPGEDGYETTEQPTETTEAPTEPAAPDMSDDDAPSSQPGTPGTTEDTPDTATTDAGPATGRGEAPEAGPAPRAQVNPPAGPITRAQERMILARFGELGVDTNDRDERLALTSGLVGRDLESTSKMTKAEAHTLIDTLANVRDRVQLYALLDEIDAARAQGADGVAP